MMKLRLTILSIAVCAFCLAACGKKNDVLPPPGYNQDMERETKDAPEE